MGKFSGILLCSDLDDTLLTTDKQVSAENRAAIEYFQREGGLFTFATGRSMTGIQWPLELVKPNAPVICFNGSGIYDMAAGQMVWETFLDQNAVRVVEFVDETYPYVGIEVCVNDRIYFCKSNRIVSKHQQDERLEPNEADYRQVREPWKKVVFLQEEDELPLVKNGLLTSYFTRHYDFVQSSPHFYEMLPKGASKGAALMILAERLGIAPSRTIGIGDNENDLTLVEKAGIGVAVANAVPALLNAADFISTDNNTNAVATIIYGLEQGLVSFAGNQ